MITIYDKKAKQFAKDCKYTKATMEGVYKDLLKLEEELIKLYHPLIFFLNYYKADAPYMGWEGSDYENMCNLTDDINTKFLELWVLVEKGLGKEVVFKEDAK